MPRSTDHSRLYASWGEADGYWDLSFTDAQRAYADVGDGDDARRGISVHVDAVTGAISLNNGFMPGSIPYQEENRLFDEFTDAIDAALVRVMGVSAPEYAAFTARTSADAERRTEALKELDARVDQHASDALDALEEEVA